MFNPDYLTLVVYFALVLLVGAIFARFNRNLSDFVRGGARATWWLVGTSMVMSAISAFTFTGNGSAAFEAGPTIFLLGFANIGALACGAIFLARWSRQTRAYTLADVVRGRFGPAVEQFFIYLNLPIGVFNAAVQLWSLAIFVSAVFGLPLQPVIIAIGVITVIYTTAGGTWAMLANDLIQGLILFGMTLLIAVLALIKVGGIGAFFAFWHDPRFAADFAWVKPAGHFAGDRFSLKWLVVLFAMQFSGQVNLTSLGRYLSAKDGREAQRAALWAMVLMTVGNLVWFIPPMVARFLYSAEVAAAPLSDPAASAYAVAAKHVLPHGLTGVLIAAMFSATMSAMDAGLASQTGVLVNNVLPRFRQALGRGPLAAERQILYCRVVTVILGIVLTGLGLLLSTQHHFSLFDAYLLVASIIGLPMIVPFLAGLAIRRLHHRAFFIIFTTALLPALYSLWTEHRGAPAWSIQHRAFWVFAWGALGVVIAFLLRGKAPAAFVQAEAAFFRTLRTPVDFAREVGRDLDVEQASIMGRIVLVMGALLLLFLLVPNPPGLRLAVACLALGIGSAGGALLVLARSKRRDRAAAELATGSAR